MKLPGGIKLLLLLCNMAFIAQAAMGQSSQRTSTEIPISTVDNLVQGLLYDKVYLGVKGSQYLSKIWELGSVNLLNQSYANLPLWYDIFADELVFLYRRADNLEFIQLIKEHIESFHLENVQFINLEHSAYKGFDLKPGYYQVVFEGEYSFLIKRRLEIQDKESVPTFVRKDQMFLLKADGSFYRIRKKKSFLKAVGEEKKKPLQAFIKREKINLQKSTDMGWLAVMQYLNNL